MKDNKLSEKESFEKKIRKGFLKKFTSEDDMKIHKDKLLSEISTLHYEREILKRENLEMEEKKRELEALIRKLKSDSASINIKNRIAEKTSFKGVKEKHKVNKKTLLIQLLVLFVLVFSVFYHDDFFKFYREDRQKINESTLDTSIYEYFLDDQI